MDDIPIQPSSAKFKSGHPLPKGETVAPSKVNPSPSSSEEPRRDFLTKACAVMAGGAITACPVVAGVAVLIDPLQHAAAEAKPIRVASLASLPADGVPRQFPVIVEYRDDAWTRYHNEPIGAVFLRRLPGDEKGEKIEAFNASCPHAGCFVAYDANSKQFKCPCHVSVFKVDGGVESGPPPRGMDSLQCNTDANGDILVTFQDFYTGIEDKKAKL